MIHVFPPNEPRPGDLEMLVSIGRALRAQKRYPEALVYFQSALELAPGDARTLSMVANAAIRAERFSTARAYLERALVTDFCIKLWQQLARVCQVLQDIPCATEQYRKVLSVDPQNEKAINGLENLDAK